jgi:radical SAM superfamily enzyme YgiQ (UPF0313 family)
MIGFPGEFEEDVFETIKLNKKIRAMDQEFTSCSMSLVAPYAGTVIHNISSDLGLIEIDDRPGFRGLCKNISFRKEPVIINPCMSKEKTIELWSNFADYINGKKEIPKKFLKTDPLREFAKNNPTAELIYGLYESYKNGPKDINPNQPKKNLALVQENLIEA